jgi:DNA-directed RNA polymerase specialized sigma24 family protein
MAYFMSMIKDDDKHILWYIYENYRNDMYNIARMIIRDNHLAEDIVQSSFERIIKKCTSLRKFLLAVYELILS